MATPTKTIRLRPALRAESVERDEKKLGKWLPHVSSAQLKAATLFYAKCRDEIEAAIEDDAAVHAEGRATQKAFPRRA